MNTIGTCVACSAGKHDECDSPGSPGEVRCPCCPDAAEHSPARRFSDALRDDSNQTNNQQGDEPMATAKKAAPVKAAAKKAAARPNVKPAEAETPKAEPTPDKPMYDECPDCGFKFNKPQPTGCRSKAACDKRKADPSYRVKGAERPVKDVAKATPTSRKAESITQMNAERQAVKDWKAAGEQGDPPATPLLDKIRADYEAKEAAKAKAKAERDAANVTPISKKRDEQAS